MRKAARRDSNENVLVHIAEYLGASVAKINQESLPDLLIGFKHLVTGKETNLLVEVKSKSGKLTPEQVKFFATWKGQKTVIREPEELYVYLWKEMGWKEFCQKL